MIEIDLMTMRSLIADLINALIEDKEGGRLSKETLRLMREAAEAEVELRHEDRKGAHGHVCS